MKRKTKLKAKPAPPPSTAEDAAKQKFSRDLLVRGEAAPLDDAGKLPLTATHEIVEDGAGETTLERRRFKLY